MRYVVKLTCSKCDDKPFTYVYEAESPEEASAKCLKDNNRTCAQTKATHTVVSVEPEK